MPVQLLMCYGSLTYTTEAATSDMRSTTLMHFLFKDLSGHSVAGSCAISAFAGHGKNRPAFMILHSLCHFHEDRDRPSSVSILPASFKMKQR